MKHFLYFFRSLFVVLFMYIYSQMVFAQGTGNWVEVLTTDFPSSGEYLYDCDGNLGIVTKKTGDHVLVFDAVKGNWERIELGSLTSISFIQANGNLAWGFAYQQLFAYSAVTGTWDTLTFSGNILSESSVEAYRSYGSSPHVAFFVTDQYFYVFDVEIGRWQSYDYGIINNLSSSTYYVRDSYIVMNQNSAQQSKLVVYSYYVKEFNQIQPGVPIFATLENGFVGDAYNASDNTVLMIGYWSVDNQFDVIQYNRRDGESEEVRYPNDLGHDSLITSAIGMILTDTQNKTIEINYYGYSTKFGRWSHAEYTFNSDLYSFSSAGYTTGGYALLNYVYKNDANSTTRFHGSLVYCGSNESFHNWVTNLTVSSNDGSVGSGKVFLLHANQNLAALDCESGSTEQSASDIVINKRGGGGNNYSFYIGNNSSDQTKLYLYDTHYVMIIDTFPAADYVYEKSNKKYSIIALTPYNTFLFYNSETNYLAESDLPDAPSTIYDLKGELGMASAGNSSVLYDFSKNLMIEKPFAFPLYSLGSGCLVGYNSTQKLIYAYSYHTGNWQEFPTDEDVTGQIVNGNIGVLFVHVNNSSYDKFYAYNSMTGSLVALDPQNNHVGQSVGTNTALVIREGRAYGFNPQSVVGISNPNEKQVTSTPVLFQNYPNPFNPITNIPFFVPGNSHITITVYNSLGQKVTTLLNKKLKAGYHKIQWDGTQYPSGIYFIKMTGSDFIDTKKVILLK